MHDFPGTTRDSIDTVVDTDSGPIRFVDTAGMRRKAKVDEPAEYYSLVRALGAIDRADACLLVIDATVGVTHQDQRLAERIDASGCAVVVVLNKWDLLDAEAREKIKASVRAHARLPRLRAGAAGVGAVGQSGAPAAAGARAKRRRPTSGASRPRS